MLLEESISVACAAIWVTSSVARDLLRILVVVWFWTRDHLVVF